MKKADRIAMMIHNTGASVTEYRKGRESNFFMVRLGPNTWGLEKSTSGCTCGVKYAETREEIEAYIEANGYKAVKTWTRDADAAATPDEQPAPDAPKEAANDEPETATEQATTDNEPTATMVQDETGTFCHAGFTLNELIQWARENHIEFDLPVYIDTGADFRAVNHVGASMDWTLGSSLVIQRVEKETAQTQEPDAATPVNQTESDSAEAGQPAPQADTTDEERINALFRELVPVEGKADTVAGEIVRAVCRIGYRYNNDGDYVGSGYGKETCNPAARYLMANAGENVAEIVRCLWKAGEECGVLDNGSYDDWLSELVKATLAYLDKHPELKTAPNAEDMWDYRDPVEDVDEWEEDEDDDEWDAA